MSNSLSVVNAQSRKFDVRIVATGDNYGLDDCLINDDAPLVEFWDMDVFEKGQFVSRYYVETIAEMEYGVGLNLDGGVDEWSIDASTMKDVIDWLKEV